jgi:hypothetical protein
VKTLLGFQHKNRATFCLFKFIKKNIATRKKEKQGIYGRINSLILFFLKFDVTKVLEFQFPKRKKERKKINK